MDDATPASAATGSRSAHRSAAGFTLIEVMVSVAVMVVVLIGLLTLLQFNSRVARAQVNVSEMQQALRAVQGDVVRLARMAGRGGLPLREQPTPDFAGMLLPQGPALGVVNDVPAGTLLGNVDEAAVVPGTDLLLVRGVISTPLYQVEPAGDGDIRGARAAGMGSIVVRSVSPTGIPHDLAPLREAVESGRPEALLLVSAGADEIRAVVELTGGTANDTEITVNFALAGTHAADYLKLSPRGEFPVGLRTVAMVGLLEEYRYYVRDADPAPRLARGRFYPGTQTPYNGDVNAHVDLADNVLDLQLALGVDRNGNGFLEDAADTADDWMFNADGDDAQEWNGAGHPLYYLRITTLARTDRAEPSYVSPAIQSIEDRYYGEPETPADGDDRLDRSYRRRQLHTVVDLRNLS